jgi:hypothetical protein
MMMMTIAPPLHSGVHGGMEPYVGGGEDPESRRRARRGFGGSGMRILGQERRPGDDVARRNESRRNDGMMIPMLQTSVDDVQSHGGPIGRLGDQVGGVTAALR